MIPKPSRPAVRATKRNINSRYNIHPESRQLPHMDRGEGAEKSKNIQKPQNHDNDHDSIQNRLNGSCHRYVAINQPEENTHHDQDHYELN
jgi:hypothetical protein